MAEGQRSIDAELIRYRIEKRMAGRRDLALHLLIYVGVAMLFLWKATWLDSPLDYLLAGGFWTLPLLLHALRYFYLCGRGVERRADEIERAIDEQRRRTALDMDEEPLIEERVSRRVTARRLLAAHGLTSAAFLAIYTPYLPLRADTPGPWLAQHLQHLFGVFGTIFALHALRFFFVHGFSPRGRAMKIDGEIERAWHESRERRRTRWQNPEPGAEIDLGEIKGRRLRLTADGEFDDEIEARSSGAMSAS